MSSLATVVTVGDPSATAQARRAAARAAEFLGLDETGSGRVALIATELTTNLIKHAGEGMLVLVADEAGVSLLALDKSQGIRNVPAASQDGFSTAGSPGTGLGALTRAADEFDIWSMPEKGTAVLCRIWRGKPNHSPAGTVPAVKVGAICIPKPGEEQSGDSWIAVNHRGGMTVAVVDGLGHGGAAATASSAAIRVISERADRGLEPLMHDLHAALRPTRGAAVAAAHLNRAAGRIDFVGVGNISGTVITEQATRKTVSHNGIVGHEMRRVQPFTYPWPPSSVFIMHSDGIGTSWRLEDYPGLAQRDPFLIAGVIFRDFCRRTDDATVLVARASS